MPELIWKLPLLRRLSPMSRGFAEAVGVIAIGSIAVAGLAATWFDPSGRFCDSLAGIGATLLVAYAVQTGWLLQNSRRRGGERENWVGVATGIGVCGLIGIGAALALSSRGGSLTAAETFVFGWSVVSIGMLGLLTAVQPWVLYGWTHSFSAE